MRLFAYCPYVLGALSFAQASPIDYAINDDTINVTPGTIAINNGLSVPNDVELAALGSNQSNHLGDISPLFKILDPVIISQAAIRPVPVYMNAIGALTTLAKRDYWGQEFPFPFSEKPYLSVSIGLEGAGKPLIDRKYAIWGIYLSTLMMKYTGVFKETRYRLVYDNAAVGTITIGPPHKPGANVGSVATGGNETEMEWLSEGSTSASAVPTSSTTPSTYLPLGAGSSPGMTVTNLANLQTNTNNINASQRWTLFSDNYGNYSAPTPENPQVSLRYQFYGEMILPNTVYCSILGALADTDLPTFSASATPPPGFALDLPGQNMYLLFRKWPLPTPRRDDPKWTYEWVFDGLKAIPQLMIGTRTFKEVNATITVDVGKGEVPVGEVYMKTGVRPGAQQVSASVATS